MKKYNKSEIMKSAWELVKKYGKTLSDALVAAWKMAKKAADLKEDFEAHDGKVTFKIWNNYGKFRAYYTCDFRSKYQNNKGHYVEL